MERRGNLLLEPRKQPVQSRSTASVEALLDATLQVLLRVGKEKLTTTLVAARAGVSVGTLYQYFPNKSALLQAALRRHLLEVTEAVEETCQRQAGECLHTMTTAVVNSFLEAKLRDAKISVALYAVSADVDGARIVQELGSRFGKAVAAMLSTASEPFLGNVQLAATVLQGMLRGVSRGLLEAKTDKAGAEKTGGEMVRMACAYIETFRGGTAAENGARASTANVQPGRGLG